MKEDTWVDRYYEALAFFYWEPQHLGRSKADGTSIRSVQDALKHLRAMEVTLNHVMNQFLVIMPTSFRNDLFAKALGTQISGEFILSGTEFRESRQKWDTCQPDFFFVTSDAARTVSLEMKIGSKSDVDQVLKYATLALGMEQQAGQVPMEHALIFLGKGSFSSLWSRSTEISTPGDLIRLASKEKDAFFDQRLSKVESLRSRFSEIVGTLAVGFLSYTDFYELLQIENQPQREVDSAHSRLITGMADELVRRNLARSGSI